MPGSPVFDIIAAAWSAWSVLVAVIGDDGTLWLGSRPGTRTSPELSSVPVSVALVGKLAVGSSSIWAADVQGELWRYDLASHTWDGPAWNGLRLRSSQPVLDLYAASGSGADGMDRGARFLLWGTYKWDLRRVRVIGFVGMARWTPFWFHRFDQRLEASQTVEATLQREEPS
jgi:hypothetical protein